MLVLSGYSENIQQKKEDTTISDKNTLNMEIAGISIVGMGLAFLVIGFPTIKSIASTVAVAMTSYKMIQQLEKTGKASPEIPV